MTDTLIQRLRDYGCCNIRKDAAVSRAQPAAPAILMSAVFVKEGADDFAPQRLLPCGSAVYLAPPDAAPSVAPEPVAWLSVDCIGERYLCFSKPMDNDTVTPLFAHPPRAPLTEEQIIRIARTVLEQPTQDGKPAAWQLAQGIARAIEQAHGIGGK